MDRIHQCITLLINTPSFLCSSHQAIYLFMTQIFFAKFYFLLYLSQNPLSLERMSLFSPDFGKAKKLFLGSLWKTWDLTNNTYLAIYEKLRHSMWMLLNKSMKTAYFLTLFRILAIYPFVLHEITYFGTNLHRNVKLHSNCLKVFPYESCFCLVFFFHLWLSIIFS